MLTVESQSQPILQGQDVTGERWPFDTIDASEIDMLHADLEAKDQEIARLKATLKEVLVPKKSPGPQQPSVKMTNDEHHIADVARRYAFTVNAYFGPQLFRVHLSAEWNPERRWDCEFIEEGHLREFQDWPMLPDLIRNQISQWAIQKRITNSTGEIRHRLKHWILENDLTGRLIFPFWDWMEGPLWGCEMAKVLRGIRDPKGKYPDNPPVLFPPEHKDDPRFLMNSPYVTEGIRALLFATGTPLFNTDGDDITLDQLAWNHCAANCTAKKYNIVEVTPGLVALSAVSMNNDETEMNLDFERQLEESMRGRILPGGGSAHISVSEHRGSQGPQILPLFISDDDTLTLISGSEDGPRVSNNGAPNDATTCNNATTQQENSLSLDEPEAKGSSHRPSDLDLGASELQESPQKSMQRRLRSQRLGPKRHEDACDDQCEVAMLRKEMQESENQQLMGGFKCRREDTFTSNSPSAGYSHTTPVPTQAGASQMEASGGPETSPPSLMWSQEPMQEGSVAGGHPHSDMQLLPSEDSWIRVECHPRCPEMLDATSRLSQISSDMEPYHLFTSLEDFIFADNCVRNLVKAEAIDIFLQQHAQIPNSPITLKNSKQMFNILDHAERENKGRSVGRFKRDHHQAVPWFFS
ncbi:uncharacterized protein EI90DRAFT_3116687 [Cantharellus anzutake]|uniref:uncharacterized protein n=1 Tax=Cantharellus anzutake TaxID=1750568 RepID=UPI0019070F34|nr:uncharacterized protein EI90DRAFT_3116687 [Cantharellus anzutake]KAF8341590.1 hypothetical protein EI90DRAFT_3116687 [Cantharellus anzutake]